MSLIDELARKLKTAERKARKAQQEYESAAATSRELLRSLEQSRNRVAEIERAITLLRNNLRPDVVEQQASNVTPMKRP